MYQGRLNDGMQLNQVKELLDARRRLLWREQRRAPGSHGRRAVVAHARLVFVTGTRTGRHIKPRRIKLYVSSLSKGTVAARVAFESEIMLFFISKSVKIRAYMYLLC